MNRWLAVLLVFSPAVHANTTVPAPPPADWLVIRGATIHTVTGETIVDGTLIVNEGKIEAIVGPDSIFTGFPTTTDLNDVATVELDSLHVYPGLIAANTVLGLVEIQAVRATVDVSEPGPINPNTRADIAINPDSENFPVARANGVLLALTTPLTSGSLIAGRSAAIQLDGWTTEDMTLEAPIGMHITLPNLRIPDAIEGAQRRRIAEQRDERLALLETSFEQALAYRQAKQTGNLIEIDRRWEAMIPVFDRVLPVFAHVDELIQIRYALRLADEFEFDLVIVGGADAWRIADVLAERDVPVIVTAVHNPPQRRWENYATPSENPVRLHEAGVRVAIASLGGTFEAPHERNLPYEAAEAVAWGLAPEEALRMITLYPAQILGIDDRVGSLEVGKDATFIVTDGDPLDIRTQVLRAYVQGREIDLSSRHSALDAKYSERLRRLAASP